VRACTAKLACWPGTAALARSIECPPSGAALPCSPATHCICPRAAPRRTACDVPRRLPATAAVRGASPSLGFEGFNDTLQQRSPGRLHAAAQRAAAKRGAGAAAWAPLPRRPFSSDLSQRPVIASRMPSSQHARLAAAPCRQLPPRNRGRRTPPYPCFSPLPAPPHLPQTAPRLTLFIVTQRSASQAPGAPCQGFWPGFNACPAGLLSTRSFPHSLLCPSAGGRRLMTRAPHRTTTAPLPSDPLRTP
jgi:hypothetical protein